MTPGDSKPTTRWGDKEGRRNDILAAAQGIIKEKGFHKLNMREVAKRAGVSPGAPYFYFKTKEEIFLTVYADCVDAFAEQIQADCTAASDLPGLFKTVALRYLDFYRDYGRHLSMWSVLSDPQALSNLPGRLIKQLQSQVTNVFTLLGETIQHLAGLHGRQINESHLTLPFLWIVLGGFVENYAGPRPEAYPYDWDEMLDFTTRTLMKGLT
ncbi:MAG TPA: TetR/AcrR family transcriptional regulator [Pseudomonadales bacterium]|nr:TetR/AcrR family transcriptional regulator [Pseudomonadales bacterium]